MWKGKVHVAHPLWAGDTNWIWECISTLDFDKQLMKAAYCFDKLPIQGDHKKCASVRHRGTGVITARAPSGHLW